MRQRINILILILIALALLGCSKATETLPKKQMPKEITQVAKISFIDDFAAYEKVWSNIQADYDNLKRLASVQPYDEAQIIAIKNALVTVEDDLQGLSKVNIQVAGKIKMLKKSQNQATQNIIKNVEQRVRMENGRANAVYKSAQAYVASLIIKK